MDLLEYTRMRLGRAIPISPEPMDMEQICRVAYDEIRAAHPECAFQLETSGELEGVFDGERIHQVLSNLLNNAVQHGTRSEPITLSAHGESGKITVKVKNYGRTIPADQLLVIFNPLVQIPPAPAEEVKESTSLGLGLYIVHEIVAMHGGTMVAESSAEDGTVFSASLPRTPAATRAEGLQVRQ